MVESFNLNIVGSYWRTNKSGMILRKDREHSYLQLRIQYLLAREMVDSDLVTLPILRDQLVGRSKGPTKRTKLPEKMLGNIWPRKWNLLKNHKNKKKRVFVSKWKSWYWERKSHDWERKTWDPPYVRGGENHNEIYKCLN